MTWDSALSHCEGLSLGDHDDWRLPSVKELKSITNNNRYIPSIDTTFFPNAYASGYWSSTTNVYYPAYAWSVYFGYGSVDYNFYKYINYYVRCVHGGQGGSFANLEVSPSSHNFGETEDGTCLWPQQFTISNTGNAYLLVSSIELSDDVNFVLGGTGNVLTDCLIDNPLGTFIEPGGLCTFSVAFCPDHVGTIDASISIDSNDPDGQGSYLNLTGIGTDDHFVWPTDYVNPSHGQFAPCTDWRNDPQGCYWLTDSIINKKTNYADFWRDVQPFQAHLYKNNGKTYGYHLGADYNLGEGSYDSNKPIYPVSSGLISKVLPNTCGWGNIIFVKHFTTFGTRIYTSMYAHVNWINGSQPEEGTPVSKDKPIALLGNGSWNCGKKNTGSWPYHLHFEFREGEDTTAGKGYSPNVVEIGDQGEGKLIQMNLFLLIGRRRS